MLLKYYGDVQTGETMQFCIKQQEIDVAEK